MIKNSSTGVVTVARFDIRVHIHLSNTQNLGVLNAPFHLFFIQCLHYNISPHVNNRFKIDLLMVGFRENL